MKTKFMFFSALSSVLVGCAGASHSIQPLAVSSANFDKMCVVDNPSLSNEVQGLVNRTVNQTAGVAAFPISSPAIASEIGCQLYMTYGGTTATDVVSFVDSFNVAIYDTATHTRVASANGKVPNNLRLDKWGASKSLIQEMVTGVMSN